MNNIWKAVILLGAFVATAQSLTCRQCPIGFFGSCLFGGNIQCLNNTESCFSGTAQFNATGILKLEFHGCLDSSTCGKTLNGAILNAAYTTSFQCCSSDLCNGVGSIQLSLTVALCAAMMSFVMS